MEDIDERGGGSSDSFLFFAEAKAVVRSLIRIYVELAPSPIDETAFKVEFVKPLFDDSDWIQEVMLLPVTALTAQRINSEDDNTCWNFAYLSVAAVYGLTKTILKTPDDARLPLVNQAWLMLADARYWHGILNGRLGLTSAEREIGSAVLERARSFIDNQTNREPKQKTLFYRQLMDEFPGKGNTEIADHIVNLLPKTDDGQSHFYWRSDGKLIDRDLGQETEVRKIAVQVQKARSRR